MSDTGPLPPPTPGTNYLANIETSLTFSLLGAFFGGFLIPLSIFLFFFSKHLARQHPVFIFNLSIIVLGLTLAAINVGQMWESLVHPTTQVAESTTLANIALDVLSPIITDSVLIFRLLAFYPRVTTPRSTYVGILAIPVIIKCARITSFLCRLAQTDGQGNGDFFAQKSWFHNPYLVSEWSLQIADNFYCASFFFWKLRSFYVGSDGSKNGSVLVRNRKAMKRHTSDLYSSTESLLAKIRGIFAIALANFVFPLLMNVTQLILIINDRSYARGAATMMTNVYVSICGVLFATVWASGNAWGRNDTRSDRE